MRTGIETRKHSLSAVESQHRRSKRRALKWWDCFAISLRSTNKNVRRIKRENPRLKDSKKLNCFFALRNPWLPIIPKTSVIDAFTPVVCIRRCSLPYNDSERICYHSVWPIMFCPTTLSFLMLSPVPPVPSPFPFILLLVDFYRLSFVSLLFPNSMSILLLNISQSWL